MARPRMTLHDEAIRRMAPTSTTFEIAEALGISRGAVSRSLIAQGVSFKQSLTTKGSSKLDPHAAEIQQLYEGGCSLTELTQKFDCDWVTLRRFMQSHGIETRKSWSRNPSGKALVTLPAETVQEMVKQYTAQDKTLQDLAEAYGLCKVSVRKLLRNAGVTLRPAHCRRKTGDEKLTTVLQRNYGIDVTGYHQMLEAQQHHCAICGCEASDPVRNKGKSRFCVDHDHQTGRVRGLLCAICNYGVGHFQDDPVLVRKAATYLESYSTTPCLPPVSDEATSTSPKE